MSSAELLGADGLPIKANQTVYRLEDHKAIVVTFVDYVDRYVSGYYLCTGARVYNLKPETLTHRNQRDSWESIEDDATRSPYSYCVRYGLDDDGIPTNEKFALDLVRRCKKLAGVSERW